MFILDRKFLWYGMAAWKSLGLFITLCFVILVPQSSNDRNAVYFFFIEIDFYVDSIMTGCNYPNRTVMPSWATWHNLVSPHPIAVFTVYSAYVAALSVTLNIASSLRQLFTGWLARLACSSAVGHALHCCQICSPHCLQLVCGIWATDATPHHVAQ